MSKEQKLAAIEKFQALNILVVGDVMIDVYDFCDSNHSRPSPERPDKKVYTAHRTLKAIGGAGNVASNLAELGVKTSLIAIAGQDGNYYQLQELADAYGINHTFVAEKERWTTIKTRIYIDDEYVFRRDDEHTHPITNETSANLVNELLNAIDSLDAVILSDYNKGLFSEKNAQQIIQACKEKNVPVIVDFKPANQAYFKNANIVAPNNIEAQAIQPDFFQTKENLAADVEKLLTQLGSENIIVTLGKDGICGFDGTSFFHLPANKVNVVDSVGCGDTVRVGLAIGHALGLPLNISADLANDAAAVVLQKLGTATLTAEELRGFIQSK